MYTKQKNSEQATKFEFGKTKVFTPFYMSKNGGGGGGGGGNGGGSGGGGGGGGNGGGSK